jgi:hypothetical protein
LTLACEVPAVFDFNNVAVLSILGAFAVPIFGIFGWVLTTWAQNWRKVRVSEHLNALKQSMIERGLSAEEIERIINAGQPRPRQEAPPAEAGPWGAKV